MSFKAQNIKNYETMTKMTSIFISYSHHDKEPIEQIVQLLRTAVAGAIIPDGSAQDLVFFDKDRLIPGTEWSSAIYEAISKSDQVFVFWCRHSANSAEVKREYQLALNLKRVTIPVLVDQTPLPQDLAPIHGVDLRALRIHGPRIRGFTPHPVDSKAIDLVLSQFSPFLRLDSEA